MGISLSYSGRVIPGFMFITVLRTPDKSGPYIPLMREKSNYRLLSAVVSDKNQDLDIYIDYMRHFLVDSIFRKVKQILVILPLLFGLFVSNAVLSQSSPQPIELDSTVINRKKLASAIITESALYLGSMSYLQFVWYKDQDRAPFHLYNDAKGYLQIDKFGHAYGAYIESYLSYKWLRSAGLSKKQALLYGGPLGVLMQTPIEIFDGLYENWGFSWPDMAANAAGSALVVGQELLFDRQLVRYKFSFYRSIYAPGSNGYLGDNPLESLFLDYNGHTYWLSMNINELIRNSSFPEWLNIAIGYSANGMYGEFENRERWKGVALPTAIRHRQLLLSPDIDWTKIPTQSSFLSGLFEALNFIKFPAPAVEYNRIDGFRAYWIYW